MARLAEAPKLQHQFIHLGLGATAVPQPPFDGMAWYDGYGERNGNDGAEGRLVSMYDFTQSWDSWEMHPAGHEVVICTAGSMTLTQEYPDGRIATVTLGPATTPSTRRAYGTPPISNRRPAPYSLPPEKAPSTAHAEEAESRGPAVSIAEFPALCQLLALTTKRVSQGDFSARLLTGR